MYLLLYKDSWNDIYFNAKMRFIVGRNEFEQSSFNDYFTNFWESLYIWSTTIDYTEFVNSMTFVYPVTFCMQIYKQIFRYVSLFKLWNFIVFHIWKNIVLLCVLKIIIAFVVSWNCYRGSSDVIMNTFYDILLYDSRGKMECQ